MAFVVVHEYSRFLEQFRVFKRLIDDLRGWTQGVSNDGEQCKQTNANVHENIRTVE